MQNDDNSKLAPSPIFENLKSSFTNLTITTDLGTDNIPRSMLYKLYAGSHTVEVECQNFQKGGRCDILVLIARYDTHDRSKLNGMRLDLVNLASGDKYYTHITSQASWFLAIPRGSYQLELQMLKDPDYEFMCELHKKLDEFAELPAESIHLTRAELWFKMLHEGVNMYFSRRGTHL